MELEKNGTLSWDQLAQSHFRMDVARKYDILLFGPRKKGRSSKADIEKAAQIAQTAAEIKAAASQVLSRGTLDDVAAVSSDASVDNVDSGMDVQLLKPFEVQDNLTVSSKNVMHVLSKLAVPKKGGAFSESLGKSLQKYKCYVF